MMGIFCIACRYIQVDQAPDLLHQPGCTSRTFGLTAAPFEAEALAALPNGGEWLTASYLRDTLRVTSLDGACPRDVWPDHKVWATSVNPGCDWPEKTTLREAYRRCAARVWLGNPHEPRSNAEEIRVEPPVERADRMGRLWASGVTGEARPWVIEEPKR